MSGLALGIRGARGNPLCLLRQHVKTGKKMFDDREAGDQLLFGVRSGFVGRFIREETKIMQDFGVGGNDDTFLC